MKDQFVVGPAIFGPDLGANEFQVAAELTQVEPKDGTLVDNGCSVYDAEQAMIIKGKTLLTYRGGCLFVQKV